MGRPARPRPNSHADTHRDGNPNLRTNRYRDTNTREHRYLFAHKHAGPDPLSVTEQQP